MRSKRPLTCVDAIQDLSATGIIARSILFRVCTRGSWDYSPGGSRSGICASGSATYHRMKSRSTVERSLPLPAAN